MSFLTEEILKDYIVRLASKGDELSESLDGLLNDPVITEYLKVRSNLGTPLWMSEKTGKEWYENLPTEWDEIIGEIQGANLYQEIDKDAIYEIPVEKQ